MDMREKQNAGSMLASGASECTQSVMQMEGQQIVVREQEANDESETCESRTDFLKRPIM